MKYQEALNRIAKYCSVNNGSMLEDDLKTLQELVDKATPKEPDKVIDTFCDDTWEYYFCPNCEKEVECENAVDDTPYCPFCGQALKWSEQ
jgi:transcription initiation factor IIE alpha subunit